jgi:dual-specificity kinase
MDISVIQSRKRPRPSSSFSDWNSIIQNNFSDPDPLDTSARDTSVIILDSEDENYEFKNKQQGDVTDGNEDLVFADDEEYLEEDGMELDERVRLNRRVFETNVNEGFNLNTELNNALIPPGAHVGLKKRRTNSLPQLPLSQISYRRVSELTKIGDIKPNVVPSGSTSFSSASSSSSSFKYMTSTNSSSPLSPVQSNKKMTDDNGYYIAEPGELFANGRFKILSILGQGTFGKVIKALDFTTNETVAIKIIRAIPKYREASKIELRVLTTLKKADPENLNHCIHLREVLDYENHICIITDLLDISLYEFLQQNKFKPFPGSQIQAITRQLVRSVAFLHDLKLIHTDLKPENILLASAQALKHRKFLVLKEPLINIIDFGSAIFEDEYHSELVSTRHYRAPEIVLGIGWSFPCDMWSLGCILVELVTGEALFSTHENLEHLAIMQKVLDAKMPARMIHRIEKSSIRDFFKKQGDGYTLNYPGPQTNEKSLEHVHKIKRLDHWICSKLKLKVKINMHDSLEANWVKNSSRLEGLDYEAFQFWYYFIDLVRSLLKYDPRERITAIKAMEHPWWDFGIIDEATSLL